MSNPQCQLCHAGTLVPAKVYRMHRAVVAVGYVIAAVSLAFVGCALWVVTSTPSDFEILNFDELESARVPAAIRDSILEWRPIPESDLTALTSELAPVIWVEWLVTRRRPALAGASIGKAIAEPTTG